MTERRLVQGFVVPDDQVLRQVVGELTPPVAGWGVTPTVRQGTVVSNDYSTSPPTCTVILGDSGASIAGVRYLAPYAPVANDLVQLINASGDLWILGRLNPARPTGTHVVRYYTNTTQSVTNGSTPLITWHVKDSNGLSEPEGATDAGLSADTFTLPFDCWWHISVTETWDSTLTSVQGIALRIETSASRLAQVVIANAATLVDPILTCHAERWLASGTQIRARFLNASGNTRTLQADGTTSPAYLTIRSLPTRTSC